jgi:hypothetical protein
LSLRDPANLKTSVRAGEGGQLRLPVYMNESPTNWFAVRDIGNRSAYGECFGTFA